MKTRFIAGGFYRWGAVASWRPARHGPKGPNPATQSLRNRPHTIRLTMRSKLFPVVLCGGAGTRLWPLSRQLLPKQFLQLVGSGSMLQETVGRLSGIADCA